MLIQNELLRAVPFGMHLEMKNKLKGAEFISLGYTVLSFISASGTTGMAQTRLATRHNLLSKFYGGICARGRIYKKNIGQKLYSYS